MRMPKMANVAMDVSTQNVAAATGVVRYEAALDRYVDVFRLS